MPQPTEYQRALEALSVNVSQSVTSTYRSLLAAGVSVEDVIDVLAPLLLSGSIEAELMAQSELARLISRSAGIPLDDALITQLTHAASIAVKQRALSTVLADADGDTRERRLQRLAEADPREAAQYAMSDAMRQSKHVAGWVRVLESSACELCEWLHRGGYVYPPDRPMTTHPGCLCTARPVTPAELIETAQARYGSSTTRHGQQQLRLWQQRAEQATRNNYSSPDEWRNPREEESDDDTPRINTNA